MTALRNNAFRLRVLANTLDPPVLPFTGPPLHIPFGEASQETAQLLRELADEAEQRERVKKALDAKAAR